MLEKQTWVYLLINSIVTIAVMLILFKFQETKIKNLLKKIDKKPKNEQIKFVEKIDNTSNTNNTQSDDNTNEVNNENIMEKNNDIDSFIDPLE